MADKYKAVRAECEKDFKIFCRIMAENHLFGDIHFEIMEWLEGLEMAYISEKPEDIRSYLMLIPRGHLKSFICACFAAWMIAKHPCITIIYLCSALNLAKLQLSLIKSMLDSPQFKRYWPEHINPVESHRERWASESIIIDHPQRKAMKVRDPTVDAVSLNSSSTGKHCDFLICDDIVDKDNYLTEEGRAQVRAADSQFSSVMNANGIKLVAGTKYHEADQYSVYEGMEEEMFDENGVVIGTRKSFEVFRREVETEGKFLWPRVQDPKRENKWEGFDARVLSSIKAQYKANNHMMQFGAQYYMNPNLFIGSGGDIEFQYYDPKKLTCVGGQWYYDTSAMEIACGGDFAFTKNSGSDYTAYAVVGATATGNHYILDLTQFKTDQLQVYWSEFVKLHAHWGFNIFSAERNSGANVILEEMKKKCVAERVSVSFDTKHKSGEKDNKIDLKLAVLDPLYLEGKMYHNRGGFSRIYEEQVTLTNPRNDDLRDAVILAVRRLSFADKRMLSHMSNAAVKGPKQISRFGGRARR